MINKVFIVMDLVDGEIWSVHSTFEGAKETVVEQLRDMSGDIWEEYVELGEGDEFPCDTFDIECFELTE